MTDGPAGQAATSFDLNADLGEGFGAWRMGDDEAMLGIVTSANVACGFHAGDAATMRRVCTRAAEAGVAVGAHVSYRDLAGFGRRRIDMPAAELTDDLLYQLAALAGMARVAGTSVTYLKAHGALYNRAADDEEVAGAVAAAAVAWDPGLAVLCLPGSAMARAAEAAGSPVVGEGYLDRAYDGRARLVPRSRPGAVIDDPAVVVARALRLASSGTVATDDGGEVTLEVASLCVHGDTPGAVGLARAVRRALEEAGVTVRSFVAGSAAASSAVAG
jgi:UPF0271 protein